MLAYWCLYDRFAGPRTKEGKESGGADNNDVGRVKGVDGVGLDV
jgi:hypothetical protein